MSPPNPLRPLSAHAIAELRELARAPTPRCGVNAGVVRRIVDTEPLAEVVLLPSPFPTHRRRLGGRVTVERIEHLQLTAAGRRVLDVLDFNGLGPVTTGTPAVAER